MIYNVYLKYGVAMYHAAKLRLFGVTTKYFYVIFLFALFFMSVMLECFIY